LSLVCNNCYISAELLDGYLDGSPPQQLIKQDNAHWPSFGVAFAFMGMVGTFAGMSAFDQLRRLAASNINNHLMTGVDPKRKYSVSRCMS
jgi:hypothetical protein